MISRCAILNNGVIIKLDFSFYNIKGVLTMKKLLTSLLFLLILSAASLVQAAPADTFHDALQQQKDPTGHYTAVIDIHLALLGKLTSTTNIDINAQPYIMHTTTSCVSEHQKDKPKSTELYAEEITGAIRSYQEKTVNDKKQWVYKDEKLPDGKTAADLMNPAGLLESVKTVSALSENEQQQTLQVVFDSSKMYDSSAAQHTAKLADKTYTDLIASLKDAGDVTANVVIDKKTGRLVSLQADITKQTSCFTDAIVKGVMEQYKAKGKSKNSALEEEILSRMLKVQQSTLDVTFGPLTETPVIPSNIKKEAAKDK